MERKRFEELMSNEEYDGGWKGDNAFQGLQIIAKYLTPEENNLIGSAEHDIIYSSDVDELLNAGITEEDAVALRNLNWMIDETDCLACFV